MISVAQNRFSAPQRVQNNAKRQAAPNFAGSRFGNFKENGPNPNLLAIALIALGTIGACISIAGNRDMKSIKTTIQQNPQMTPTKFQEINKNARLLDSLDISDNKYILAVRDSLAGKPVKPNTTFEIDKIKSLVNAKTVIDHIYDNTSRALRDSSDNKAWNTTTSAEADDIRELYGYRQDSAKFAYTHQADSIDSKLKALQKKLSKI